MSRTTRQNVQDAPKSRASKRAASPHVKPLAQKRTRIEKSAPPIKNTVTTGERGRSEVKPVTTASHRRQVVAINPIPTPPDHLRPAPRIFVWGAGNFGQFGMGPDYLDEFPKPKKNTWVEENITRGTFGAADAGFEAVAAGGLHTIFIDENGTIWSCGVNDDAALGRVTKDVPHPEKSGEFLDVDELTAVPHPLQSLVDEKFRAVKIVAGDSISAAVSSEGELRVWGSFRANEGSLGFSSGLKHQFLPAPILEFKIKPGDAPEKVVSVAAGTNHLVVLTTLGNIYTLGAGEQGQLGRRVLERRKIHGTNPEKITLGSRTRKAVVVGAGSYHSFAVDDSGDVWGWGLNTMGQTGTGYGSPETSAEVQLPTRVLGLSKDELGGATIVEIVGGEHHSVFLTSDGRVYTCGRSDGGQLGLADDHKAFSPDREFLDFVPQPTLVAFPDQDDPVKQVCAGTHNNMAVTADGALYAWGQGSQSELGTGSEEARTPTIVVRRQGGSWAAIAVACGGQHTLGLFRQKTS